MDDLSYLTPYNCLFPKRVEIEQEEFIAILEFIFVKCHGCTSYNLSKKKKRKILQIINIEKVLKYSNSSNSVQEQTDCFECTSILTNIPWSMVSQELCIGVNRNDCSHISNGDENWLNWFKATWKHQIG